METGDSDKPVESPPADPAPPAMPPPLLSWPPPVADAPARAPVGTFYRVDSSRASFGELRRDQRTGTATALAWAAKLLRVKLPGSVNDPNVEALAPFEVDAAAVPPEAMARLAPEVEQLRALGFEPVAWYAVVDLYHSSRLHFVLLAQASGPAVGRLVHRAEGGGNPPKTHFHADFLTELADGRFVLSTSAVAYQDAPPGAVLNAQPGMEASLLWASHRQRVDLMKAQGVAAAAALASPEHARALLDRHHAAVRDHHLRRRVFAPMTREELEHAAAADRYRAGAAAGRYAEPEILAELEKLQNRKASWGATILILVVSLALFVGTGTRAFAGDWQFLGMLVGILFFHELGHYVAMRGFRYRNLRMFFIPFLGAAVSGRHYNVPGWKKVIVALAGPLPGIVVGAAVGFAGVASDNPAMVKLALVTLVLNGMNLLPVLPLDGGQVVHALLFARHPLLDVAFRLVAGVVLIVVPMLTGGKFLMVLGGLMLFGIPIAYRRARIALDLRREGLPSVSPDSQTIPPDVAQVIIGRIRAAFPVKMSNQTLAQHVLNVYETINARPPGLPASLGLGAIHVGSFLFAVLAAGLIFVARQPGGLSGDVLASFERQVAQSAQTPLDPAAIRTAGTLDVGIATPADTEPSTATAPADGQPRVLVAHFDDRAAADRAFDETRQQLADGAAVRQFGQTVMLALPEEADDSDRRTWFDFFESRTKQVFAGQGASYTLSIRAKAPSLAVAEATEREAAEYLNVPRQETFIVPPWHPDDVRTPDERRRHQVARRTYLNLQEAVGDVYDDDADPELKELTRAIRDATRRDEQAEFKRLLERQQAIIRERQAKAIARVGAALDADPEVVKIYTQQMDDGGVGHDGERSAAQLRYARALAERFGQLPMAPASTQPVRGADRFSATAGHVTREDETLTISYLSFTDVFHGPPAVVEWLVAQGFTDFHYGLRHFGFADELDDDFEE